MGGKGSGRQINPAIDKFIEDAINWQKNFCLIWVFARDNHGYAEIHRKKKKQMVSHIVCKAVYGPKPTPKHEVAHSCGNGHFGCVAGSHLRWATRKENHADKLFHGTSARETNYGNAKLTREQVIEIRKLKGNISAQKEIAELFGISISHANGIANGKKWTWLDMEPVIIGKDLFS